MKISVILSPCFKCLTTCPTCKHIDNAQRDRLARAAWETLHLWFPALVPAEPPEDENKKEGE